MTLNDALLLKKSYLHLIGNNTEKIPFIISDIIVTPDDNYEDFMNHYYCCHVEGTPVQMI